MRSIEADKIVLSIPHSGTRALCKHLNTESYTHYNGKGPQFSEVHIPIRNPQDVAESWARRGKSLLELLRNYREQREYFDQGKFTAYQVEAITKHGTDDPKDNPSLKVWWYRTVVKHIVKHDIYEQWYA